MLKIEENFKDRSATIFGAGGFARGLASECRICGTEPANGFAYFAKYFDGS